MTTAARILKCEHCGATGNKAGKPFTNKGALALHEQKHCPEKPTGGAGAAAAACCANPSIRLLKKTDQRELFMLHHGYMKVCSNCEECFK